MKFNIIVNSSIILIAAVLLITLAFHVNATTAVNSVAILKTSDMTCGSCSSKISAALGTLKGVAITEVDMKAGWVIVGYDSNSVKPEVLAEKITHTGFNSFVHQVLTPEQFKQTTGKYLGNKTEPGSGCCGGKGGSCGFGKRS
jgi:copper chaperone CopZ